MQIGAIKHQGIPPSCHKVNSGLRWLRGGRYVPLQQRCNYTGTQVLRGWWCSSEPLRETFPRFANPENGGTIRQMMCLAHVCAIQDRGAKSSQAALGIVVVVVPCLLTLNHATFHDIFAWWLSCFFFFAPCLCAHHTIDTATTTSGLMARCVMWFQEHIGDNSSQGVRGNESKQIAWQQIVTADDVDCSCFVPFYCPKIATILCL